MLTDATLAFENPIEVMEPEVAKASQPGIFVRAFGAVLVWYDAFAYAQEMATHAQKQRPRLGE